MPIIITGDVHLHPHQAWSTILENGRNSRLQNGLDCLLQASERAGKGGLVVVAGDLFDDRVSVPVDAIDACGEWLDRVDELDQEVLITVGNHDMHLRDASCNSLRMLRQHRRVHLFEQVGSITLHGIDWTLVPYKHNYVELAEDLMMLNPVGKGRPKVCIMHADFVGATQNGGRISTKGLDPNHPALKCFDYVISGHYHRPQQIHTNVWYVGSPYQLDRGEQGEEKRFIRFSSDLQKIETVPVMGMPTFKTKEFDEFKPEEDYNDFVNVVCDSPEQVEQIGKDNHAARSILQAPNVVMEFKGAITVADSVVFCLDDLQRPDLKERALALLS